MRFILLGSMVAFGCASPSESPPKDAECIGMTLGEAIEALELTLDESPVIEEPPGIARGLQCKTPNGQGLWLYFRRDAAPFNKHKEWTVEKLGRLKVVGVARQTPTGWVTEGVVIWYYHSN
jgi:hypothetical protein